MVCNRCIMTVENILKEQNIPINKISLGEVELLEKLTAEKRKTIEAALQKVGFELIDTRVNKIIEDIKQAVMEYLFLGLKSMHERSQTLGGKIQIESAVGVGTQIKLMLPR